MIMVASSFLKSSVFTMFPSTLKRKASVFKFLRFGKLFSDGVVWTVGLTVEIKLCLSGVVWMMTKEFKKLLRRRRRQRRLKNEFLFYLRISGYF